MNIKCKKIISCIIVGILICGGSYYFYNKRNKSNTLKQTYNKKITEKNYKEDDILHIINDNKEVPSFIVEKSKKIAYDFTKSIYNISYKKNIKKDYDNILSMLEPKAKCDFQKYYPYNIIETEIKKDKEDKEFKEIIDFKINKYYNYNVDCDVTIKFNLKETLNIEDSIGDQIRKYHFVINVSTGKIISYKIIS